MMMSISEYPKPAQKDLKTFHDIYISLQDGCERRLECLGQLDTLVLALVEPPRNLPLQETHGDTTEYSYHFVPRESLEPGLMMCHVNPSESI